MKEEEKPGIDTNGSKEKKEVKHELTRIRFFIVDENIVTRMDAKGELQTFLFADSR